MGSDKKWTCRRPQTCGRLAKKFSSNSESGTRLLLEALSSNQKIYFPFHADRQLSGRAISKRVVERVIRALDPQSNDMDVFSEVIDCQPSGDVILHGIIRLRAGDSPRHIHVVLRSDRSCLVVKTAYDPADEAEIWDADFRKRLCFCPKKERREFYRTVDRDVW